MVHNSESSIWEAGAGWTTSSRLAYLKKKKKTNLNILERGEEKERRERGREKEEEGDRAGGEEEGRHRGHSWLILLQCVRCRAGSQDTVGALDVCHL